MFLQRAATVARRAGTELAVVGVPEGSLIIKLRAVSKAAGKEFNKTPLSATASAAAIGTVIVAIVHAMIPSGGKITPIANAGAQLVENHQVQSIQVITINQTFIVMDPIRAAQVRMLQARGKEAGSVKASVESAASAQRAMVPKLVSDAQRGALGGDIFEVDGELHFRPERFRYLVPIDPQSPSFAKLRPDQHVTVSGTIVTLGGLPDRIVIETISPQ